ncbi:MAG: glycosyltransferase [Ruminococcaceae bacterium]|nr:glycosyltransferase [Oscillospiraceae bacterium]
MYKILHVITDKNIGGAGVLTLSLLRHTDRTRFAPVVALPCDSLLLPRARALGVRVCPLPPSADGTLALAALPEMLRILWREKPDLLHTNAALFARLAALPFRRMACVDTKHCCFPPSPLQKSAPARLINRALERASEVRYILTAEAARGPLLLCGSSPSRATVICGGAERVPRLDEAKKEALRASLGIPKDAFVVGYAARVERGKGHEHLLAAARLLSNRKDIFFLAVGGGSLLPALQKAARGMKNLVFAGFRADIGEIMNLFDLNLNLSYLSETSPLSLSEGMSLGIPIVVTRIGGNAAMAKGCGIVLPPRNPRALADAILRLADDKSLYTSLSSGARRRYPHYSAPHMTAKTEALYLWLLKHK